MGVTTAHTLVAFRHNPPSALGGRAADRPQDAAIRYARSRFRRAARRPQRSVARGRMGSGFGGSIRMSLTTMSEGMFSVSTTALAIDSTLVARSRS